MFGRPKVGSTKFQRICQHPNIDGIVKANPNFMLPAAIAGVAFTCGVKLIEDKTIWPGADKGATDKAVFEAAVFAFFRARRTYALLDDIAEFVGVENVDPDDAQEIVSEAFAAAGNFMIVTYVEHTGQPDKPVRAKFAASAGPYLEDDNGVANLALELDRLSGKPIALDLRKAVTQMVSHSLIERTLIPGAVESIARAIKLELEG